MSKNCSNFSARSFNCCEVGGPSLISARMPVPWKDDRQSMASGKAEIRGECLISSFESLKIDPAELHRLAGLLRTLSGVYDQAARAATSL